MTLVLDHTIVPARDKAASAKYFAKLFGLSCGKPVGPFAPVQVNAALTFDFDDRWPVAIHHYAFHLSEAEEIAASRGELIRLLLLAASRGLAKGDC